MVDAIKKEYVRLKHHERDFIAESTTFPELYAKLEQPLLWGKTVWTVNGVGSPEPEARPEDPSHEYFAVVRLAPINSVIDIPDSTPEWLLSGDSDILIPADIEPKNLTLTIGRLSVAVEASLVANSAGRLAAITVKIPQAQRSVDAFRAARSVFDALQMQLCFEQDMPLRESAIVVFRTDGQVRVGRFAIGYPRLDLDLSTSIPSNIMQRLITPYASALQSPTAYYSFMVYFSLLEFMLKSWIGAIRAAYERRGAQLPKRSYVLDQPEIAQIAPWMKGKSFQDALTDCRHLRNRAGGSHFDFSIGPRVGTVVTDDEIACARDLIKIAVKSMLVTAREDIEQLRALGAVDEAALAIEMQTYLDRHDGHKTAAKKAKKRRR